MADVTPVDREDGGPTREFKGVVGLLLGTLCAGIALSHIYLAFDPIISELQRNAFHFAGFAFLACITAVSNPGDPCL